MKQSKLRALRWFCLLCAVAAACSGSQDPTELDGGAAPPSDAACQCNACIPGEVRCSGSMLQHCNAEGSGFDTVDVCFDLGGFARPPRRDPALCDAANDRCLRCVPESSRCVKDVVEKTVIDTRCSVQSLQQAATIARCSADGMSEVESSCGGALGAYCHGRGSNDETVPDAKCFARCERAFDCDINAPACAFECNQGYCSYTCCNE